jgi:uncharacterized protein YbdZ (MbtH family)
MEFSNPFDNPQGQFYILRNDQAEYSLWPQQCALPAGWRWCANRSPRRRAAVAGGTLADA